MTQSRTTANLEQYIGSGAMSSASALKRYAQCNCPAEYNKDSCPSNSVCEECDGKFKKTGCNSEYNRTFTEITIIKENASCLRCTHEGVTLYSCTCKSGYVLKKGSTLKEDTCVPDCAGYTLTTCPPGGICEECTVNNTTKHRLKDCDGSKGWKYGSGTCEAVPCTTGYTADVTTCASGSTKPDISLSDDWSGGQHCTSLGYTKNILNCIDRNIIKCPFDSSKISCF